MAVQSKLLRPFNAKSRTPLLVLLATLLLLRSRLVEIPKAGIDKLKKAAAGRPSEAELKRALQEVYVDEKDGSRTLLVPSGTRLAKVNVQPIPPSTFVQDAPRFPLVPPTHKPSVDGTFLKQLLAILRLSFRSPLSAPSRLIYTHSFFLIVRTMLSIAVARLDGYIVRNIVSADRRGFLRGLALWFALAVPSTATNSMIRHLQGRLAARIRTTLTRYTTELYLSGAPDLRYYRVAGEGALEGVDQYIASDVAAFAESFSVLYGNLLKPSFDILLFTAQLSRGLGARGTLLLFANYYVTARVLRAATPAFGRLAAVEARLEGEYRAGMGRVGRESEEIAFYNGGARERHILRRAYLRLIKHVNSIYKIRIAYEWTEDYVIKYLWSAAGYGLISIPYLLGNKQRDVGVQAQRGIATGTGRESSADSGRHDAVADRTEGYISSRRLLLSLADAGGRLMYAYKDLLELAGLTTRLYTLLSTLHNLPALPVPEIAAAGRIEIVGVDVAVPASGLVAAASQEKDAEDEKDLEEDETVKVSEVLVKDLNLTLAPGEHLMITGSNGVGKTAIARVLAGLWAPKTGLLRRPPSGVGEVFVVPQRAYMVAGSLIDQIVYPHSYAEYKKSGRSEEELMEILESVYLAYLPEREGGWETRKEWRDVLSGGEKQRMGLARVFYHRPQYAILDEATSAVSSDVEGRMYEHAKAIGITLITISLRPSLMKYHTHLLHLAGDGTGAWNMHRVGAAEERMEIDREILTLENKLAEVEKWEKRRDELERLLSTQEAAEDAEA